MIKQHQKSWSAVIVSCHWLVADAPEPVLITSLAANMFPNKLAPDIPDSNKINPLFCFFAKMFFISSFEIISIVMAHPYIFFWVAVSVNPSGIKTAAVNPNGIKTHVANGLYALFINGKPAVNNGLRDPPFWFISS